MRRKLLIVSVLIAAGLLAWEYVPIVVKVWDGGYGLTVNVSGSAAPLCKVSCEAFGSLEPAEAALEYLLPPDSSSYSAIADPFNGEPLKVRVAVSGRESQSGRELRRSQFRYLVVIGTFQDGRQVGKLVEIPDGRECREITVTLPPASDPQLASDSVAEKDIIGKRVAEILDKYQIGYNDLTFHDEPPGKLRRISFRNLKLAPKGDVVYLDLKYDISLFSVERTWQKGAVLQAEIKKVEILPR